MRAQIYALVKRNSDCGIYKLGSCTTEKPLKKDALYYPFTDTELIFLFDTHPEAAFIFYSDGIMIEFYDQEKFGCTEDWLTKIRCENYENQMKMLELFSASNANAGRGWNQTRRTIVDTMLAQLQKGVSSRLTVLQP